MNGAGALEHQIAHIGTRGCERTEIEESEHVALGSEPEPDLGSHAHALHPEPTVALRPSLGEHIPEMGAWKPPQAAPRRQKLDGDTGDRTAFAVNDPACDLGPLGQAKLAQVRRPTLPTGLARRWTTPDRQRRATPCLHQDRNGAGGDPLDPKEAGGIGSSRGRLVLRVRATHRTGPGDHHGAVDGRTRSVAHSPDHRTSLGRARHRGPEGHRQKAQ